MLEDELADGIVAPIMQGPEGAGTLVLFAHIGAWHGIATPLNKALTALLAAIRTEP